MSSTALCWVTASCLLTGGCTEDADIPDVPDLESLQEQYDDPTATVDVSDVRAILDRYPELERYAAALQTADPLLDGVDAAREAANQRSGRGIDLRGTLNVNVSCPGAERTPRYDDTSNGRLSIALAVEHGEIKRTFWATAAHCVLRGTFASRAFPVELDGTIAFDVGAPIGLRNAWQRGRTLLSMDGPFVIDEALTLSGLSARFGTGQFEYLQQIDDGSVVLLVTDDGVGLRDRDTTWFCERGGTACGAR